jgi:hypothetical protein
MLRAQLRAADLVPIDVNDTVVGYIQFLDMGETQDLRETAEAAFLDRMSRAILISAAGAGLLALVLGIALASTISRPVRELTDGTKARWPRAIWVTRCRCARPTRSANWRSRSTA